MKKIFVLLLGAAFFGAVLSGCGRSSVTEQLNPPKDEQDYHWAVIRTAEGTLLTCSYRRRKTLYLYCSMMRRKLKYRLY